MPSLDVITNTFFPRNMRSSSLFARKARVNTERVPPGHPIILVKSDKLNMAAVSVKRSIELKPIMGTLLRSTTDSVDRGRWGGGAGGFAPSLLNNYATMVYTLV